MKKILKNWNWFEIIFLVVSVVLITTCFVVGADKNWLSFVVSLIGVCGALFLAKGFVVAPYINATNAILYSILTYTQGFYGEMIVYLSILLPMNVFSIFAWFRNKKKENSVQVEINKVGAKEYICLAAIAAATTVAFYFVLKALNTNQLILSTFAFTTLAVATYLALRRSSFYAIFYMLNDVLLIVMWSITTANEGIGFLPTTLCFGLFLVNDVYGFVRWRLDEKKQKLKQEEQPENKKIKE